MEIGQEASVVITKWFILLFLSLIIFSGIYFKLSYVNKVGENAVKLMYDFDDVSELDSNMYYLKNITTDTIFSALTIDNDERTMYTYLKFKGGPVSVNIIKSTNSYVLYSINSDYIASNRVFIFTYSTNIFGKINYEREMECVDFISDDN